jgi:hypothetical protein
MGKGNFYDQTLALQSGHATAFDALLAASKHAALKRPRLRSELASLFVYDVPTNPVALNKVLSS